MGVQALLDTGVTNLLSSQDEVDQPVHAALMKRLGTHSLSQAASEHLLPPPRRTLVEANPLPMLVEPNIQENRR